MPPTTTDDQVKFLISCIRYSNNGTIDFTGVATECSIVSKGAAKDVTSKATTPSPAKPKAAAKDSAASKKRKIDSANDTSDEDDERSAKSVYEKWEEEACPDKDEKIKTEEVDGGVNA